MLEKGVRIIIAGGGTGGHLFPGIAIAEEFRKREGNPAVLFVVSGKGREKGILNELGYPARVIRVEGFKGRGLFRALGALVKVPGSIWESYRIISGFRPHLVMGVGGYASGPVVLAAFLLGIKTAVAEQNVFPGVTNRILGKFANKVFLTYRESNKWFPAGRTLVSGNPVRAAFLAAAGQVSKKGERFTVMIFGGSQGARSINRMAVKAIPMLKEKQLDLKIIHQTGDADLQYVSDMYRYSGIEASVSSFITDMAAAYGEADLVVCRAGATSLAEIAVMGKAAVLIPYPFAVDDHQSKNAEALVRTGAAIMIEERGEDGTELGEVIEMLYKDREMLKSMTNKAATLGNPGAAKAVVDVCMDMIGKR